MRRRILVADDDRQICSLISGFLEKSGFDVDEADGITSAMDLLQTREYDVILTDKNMPYPDGSQGSGMSLLEYAQKYHSSVPVLLMTGYPTVETARDAIKLGAFDYLVKPFSMKTLKEKIDQVFEYVGLTQSDEVVRTYRVLHKELLEVIDNRDISTMDDLHASLSSIADVLDRFSKTQEAMIRQGLLQKRALEKINAYSRQLVHETEAEDAAHGLAKKIFEESKLIF